MTQHKRDKRDKVKNKEIGKITVLFLSLFIGTLTESRDHWLDWVKRDAQMRIAFINVIY